MSCQRCFRFSANTPFCARCEDFLEAKREREESMAGFGRIVPFRPSAPLPLSDDDFRGAA